MEHRPTHDEDGFAWSQHQAAVLRRLGNNPEVLLKCRDGMRRHIDLERLWRLAVRDARADLADEGDALFAVPAACPLTLDVLLDEAFDVDRTVAVLRTVAPCA